MKVVLTRHCASTLIVAAVPLHQPCKVRLWPSSLLGSSWPAVAPDPCSDSSPALITSDGRVNWQRSATEPLIVTVPVADVV